MYHYLFIDIKEILRVNSALMFGEAEYTTSPSYLCVFLSMCEREVKLMWGCCYGDMKLRSYCMTSRFSNDVKLPYTFNGSRSITILNEQQQEEYKCIKLYVNWLIL